MSLPDRDYLIQVSEIIAPERKGEDTLYKPGLTKTITAPTPWDAIEKLADEQRKDDER